MIKILTLTNRRNIEKLFYSLPLEEEREVVVVFDEKNWERKIDREIYDLPTASLVFLPSKSHYVERRDIQLVRYGDGLRRIDRERKYPNGEPGRILSLPDGLLGELMFSVLDFYGLSDDFFSLFVPIEEDTFFLHEESEVRALVDSYPFSSNLAVLLHIERDYDPVALSEAFLSATHVFVISKDPKAHRKLEKRCDRIIFSPMVRKFSSLSFLESEEMAISLLPSTTTIVRIYLRSDR